MAVKNQKFAADGRPELQWSIVHMKKSMDGASEQMQSIGNDSEQVISKHHVSHWQVFSKLVPRAELVYPILVGSVEEKHGWSQ